MTNYSHNIMLKPAQTYGGRSSWCWRNEWESKWWCREGFKNKERKMIQRVHNLQLFPSISFHMKKKIITMMMFLFFCFFSLHANHNWAEWTYFYINYSHSCFFLCTLLLRIPFFSSAARTHAHGWLNNNNDGFRLIN